ALVPRWRAAAGVRAELGGFGSLERAGDSLGDRRARAPCVSPVPPAVGAQRRPDRRRPRAGRLLVDLPQARTPAAAPEQHPPAGGTRPRAVLARPPVAGRGQRALGGIPPLAGPR